MILSAVADLVKSLFGRLLLQHLVQVFLNNPFIFIFLFLLSFSFPTIYFSPAGQKMNPKKYEASFFNSKCLDISFKTLALPVWVLILPAVKLLFQGGREVSDFLSYLKKEATNTPVVAEEPKKKKKKHTEF